jgi:hypothetical protein
VKPAIVSIFSFFLPALLFAECQPLTKTAGAAALWIFFSDTYGPARFPKELTVCTGKKYFFEIKGGAKMQSALDRKKGRILRRDGNPRFLNHELAHAYLDMRWRVLPYPIAEPLVLVMADPAPCELVTKTPEPQRLRTRWANRTQISRCELLQLLKDVLNSGAELRDSLPLN